MKRLGLRMRLTLIYGGLFFLAGSVLVWFTYLSNSRSLNVRIVGKFTGTPPTGPEVDRFYVNDAMQGLEQSALNVQNDMLRTSIIILVAVGLVALIIGYFVADRALRPLERVTETAQRLSESNLHERIGLRGPADEVKKLADTFDAMLDRLHRVFDNQRRFIANASHELRTPLAINRTVLEVALEEPEVSEDLRVLARSLLGTNARYERLIEGLLLLAESSEELAVRKPVDLSQIVRTALADVPLRSAEVTAELPAVMVDGDPLLLERCVFNLLENAAKYNVKHGHIWVAVGLDGSLRVENTGPAVPPYEVDDLFEPFRRGHGDRVRSARGSGLGLSIVRAIVEAHGGTVVAVARPAGGLAVTVRLTPAGSGSG
ncbi:sensor histidine kinase [Nonomuraea soli]|uniref:histidine kinase n=1 Tax=Nonomuraea soli TaxID=1032476 RepID=A0A7W0CUQ6_9ACTN|nr:HAMP domain-containing sensor histidine kinase [Nonomuraea soli]MBA2897615.1 signal transduction histidine kinase [Nonomuraea soli]